jgi:hypothetical protein
MVTTSHDERWGQMANCFHLIKSKVEIKYFQVKKKKYTIPSRSINRGMRWPQSVIRMNEREKWQIVSCLWSKNIFFNKILFQI